MTTKRPFRVERHKPNPRVMPGFVERLETLTFASEAGARGFVSTHCDPGTRWKIVERRRQKNAQGRGCWRMHVVAEGVA